MFATQFLLIIVLGILFFSFLCAIILMSDLKEGHELTLYVLSGVVTMLFVGIGIWNLPGNI